MGRSLGLLVASTLLFAGCDSGRSERAAAPDAPVRAGAAVGEPSSSTSTVAPPPALQPTTSTSSTAVRPERWVRLPDAPVRPGLGTSATWTGRELIVVGGMPTGKVEEAGMSSAAAAFDPAANRWRRLPPAPGPGRSLHAAVWSGAELIVWGGRRPGGYASDGAAFNPATGRWRTIAAAPIGGAEHPMAAWTGEEMVVWGGNRHWEPTGDGAA